jgi:hypothetical protein
MIWECFCFGTACSSIIFAVAIVTTISCSLGRWYGPMLSISFFDVYGKIGLREVREGGSLSLMMAVKVLYIGGLRVKNFLKIIMQES